MSYFIFNGANSNNLGLIITKPIVRPTWIPEVEFVGIPGRTRQVAKTQRWYPNKSFTVEAVVSDASPTKMQMIYKKLQGYGTLAISTSPDELLNCYVEKVDPDGVALLMAEFPITFIVEPFAYSSTEREVNFSNQLLTFRNNGDVFVDPQIIFSPTVHQTDLYCNDKWLFVRTPPEIIESGYSADYSITIDCEGQLAYYTRPNGENVACTQYTSGPFPRLPAGDNVLSVANVHYAVAKFRERWY